MYVYIYEMYDMSMYLGTGLWMYACMHVVHFLIMKIQAVHTHIYV